MRADGRREIERSNIALSEERKSNQQKTSREIAMENMQLQQELEQTTDPVTREDILRLIRVNRSWIEYRQDKFRNYRGD